jgi:hypothetical protein
VYSASRAAASPAAGGPASSAWRSAATSAPVSCTASASAGAASSASITSTARTGPRSRRAALLAGGAQQRADPVGELDGVVAGQVARQLGEPALQPVAEQHEVDPGGGERAAQRGGRRLQRGEQDVRGVDPGVARAAGDPARALEQRLDLVGQRV